MDVGLRRVGERKTLEVVIAMTAVSDFKTVKTFATAVTERMKNLAGLRDAPFDIWGRGGGAKKNWKK